jgi:hypothetical protein
VTGARNVFLGNNVQLLLCTMLSNILSCDCLSVCELSEGDGNAYRRGHGLDPGVVPQGSCILRRFSMSPAVVLPLTARAWEVARGDKHEEVPIPRIINI